METKELIINASAEATVDIEKRTITGLILPFSAVGATSAGRTRISAGAVKWSDKVARVKLLREHQAQDVLGMAVNIEEKEDGLYASFKVPEGANGDRALQEAKDGLRDGLSVGLYEIQASKETDGVIAITAGTLREVSLVSIPAFDDARVSNVSASLSKEDNMTEDTVAETAPLTASAVEAMIQEALKPITAASDIPVVNGSGDAKKELGLDEFSKIAANAFNDRSGQSLAALTAALSDVVPADSPNAFRPVYATELWEGTSYTRTFIDNAVTLAPMPATGMKLVASRWVTKPLVDDYAGNKTEVPSNPVEMEDVEVAIKRVAGAWDIDRAYFDRGDAAFIRNFLEAQAEGYARKTNAIAVATALAFATALDADAGTGGTQAYASLMEGILGGAVALAGNGERVDYVAIAPNLISEWLNISTSDAPAYLSGAFNLANLGQGNFSGLNVFVEPSLTAGTFLIGAKSALRFHEATPPIQVQAVNLPNGGIDLGVFGYIYSYGKQASQIRKGTVA